MRQPSYATRRTATTPGTVPIENVRVGESVMVNGGEWVVVYLSQIGDAKYQPVWRLVGTTPSDIGAELVMTTGPGHPIRLA